MSSPCLFVHHGKKIHTTVHGDDFTSTGGKLALDWLEMKLKEKYELTVGPRVGPGHSDAKEVTVLNRVIRWTEAGLELEADPRQAEKLIAECGLEGAKSVSTPGKRISNTGVGGHTLGGAPAHGL